MQFIESGPDIPGEIFRAQEEGHLVLFCGAGISMPAGLPNFEGLITEVYSRLSASPEPMERHGLDGKSFDRVLNLLEQRFGRAQLRGEVRRILAVPQDPVLDAHRAIVDLATDRAGHVRLVTTNFDLLFEAAIPGLRTAAAPLLPVPKPHKWDCLVHLHGRIMDEDPDGQHLVLTSADFGIAYLVERWASRFVAELLTHCTVLFVGYSVDDPVMRYLVDAIAVERRMVDRPHGAFILTGAVGDEAQAEKDEWESRGITPVFYDPDDDHAALYRTLKAWAGIWKRGLESKLNIVNSLGVSDPATLSTEKISQFCWAVSDPSGAMARELASLGKRASLAWLEVLERDDLLRLPATPVGDFRVGLVNGGGTAQWCPALDPVRRGLAFWLAEHLDDPSLVAWTVRSGGHLHPEVAQIIRIKLAGATAIPPGLRTAWRALTGSIPLATLEDQQRSAELLHRASDSWSPELRVGLLQALAPCMALRPLRRYALGAGHGEGPEFGKTVRSVLAFDCELAAGSVLEPLLARLRERSDWRSILAELSFELTGMLRRALDLHAFMDSASEDEDPSYMQRPSIAPHSQNRSHEEWTTLIDLLREAVEATNELDGHRAQLLASTWLDVPYPTFRRLMLHAFQIGGVVDATTVLNAAAARPDQWIWSVMTQVEFLGSLSRLYVELEGRDQERLLQLLLVGPPKDMFRHDLQPQEWEELRDHLIWRRLAKLRAGGTILAGEAESRLARLEEGHGEWRLTGEQRDDFPVWMEVGWGLPTDMTASELLALEDDQLLETIRDHKSNREGLLRYAWPGMVEAEPRRAMRILRRLLEIRLFAADVWSHALDALQHCRADVALAQEALGLLRHAPPEMMEEATIVRAVADLLRAFGEKVDDDLRAEVLEIWDKTLPATLKVKVSTVDDWLTTAINHPTGILVETLLAVFRTPGLQRDAGVPEDVRIRCERVIVASEEAARLGRVVLASRLPLFHNLDSKWTEGALIPLFNWTNEEEAISAWQGFLYSPWMSVSLWRTLKRDFIAAFGHFEKLGSPKRNLPALLASVSIESDEALTPAEAGNCLRKLDDVGRGNAAFWIHQRLKGAEGQAGTLWRSRVGPWLASAWPKEPGLRGRRASLGLASAAMQAGESFESAVVCVVSLIGPIEHDHGILAKLDEEGLIAREPAGCLALVDALTPAEPLSAFGQLTQFLGRVLAAQPSLAADPRYQRLQEAAIRRGI